MAGAMVVHGGPLDAIVRGRSDRGEGQYGTGRAQFGLHVDAWRRSVR